MKVNEMSADLSSLPVELIVEILEFLSPQDYVAALEASPIFCRDPRQHSRKMRQHRGRWFSLKSSLAAAQPQYLIHHNGGRPWKVCVRDSGDIDVLTQPLDWELLQVMCEVQRVPAPSIESFNATQSLPACCNASTAPHCHNIGTVPASDWIGLWAPEDCASQGKKFINSLPPGNLHSVLC